MAAEKAVVDVPHGRAGAANTSNKPEPEHPVVDTSSDDTAHQISAGTYLSTSSSTICWPIRCIPSIPPKFASRSLPFVSLHCMHLRSISLPAFIINQYILGPYACQSVTHSLCLSVCPTSCSILSIISLLVRFAGRNSIYTAFVPSLLICLFN